MDYTTFERLLSSGQPIHLIGIGGVSMRALARMLRQHGACVRGSDRDTSKYVEDLIAEGIPVTVGHFADNPVGACLVIRTAAIHDDNPEIVSAMAAGTPILSRAEAWGLLMGKCSDAVCVAGTHGKTSTTSMIATFTQSAALDPTVMVGGELRSIGGTLRIGHSGLMVAEACEYQNSYHSFLPTIAVILNIDRDHLDFFKNVDEIEQSFRHFAELVPQERGVVIANGDDDNTRTALAGLSRRIVWFGEREDCDVRPARITQKRGCYACDVLVHGRLWCRMTLSVPGRHNLQNALAAAAVAVELGVPSHAFVAGMKEYTGVGRRLEYRRSFRGAQVYDDFAHHPGEISSSLATAREITDGRVLCLFQPHTYSRTVALLDEFADALKAADQCVICPIYAARETNTWGISHHDLAARIPGALAAESLEDAAAIVARIARPEDFIFTMGAGDVWKVSDLLPADDE